MQLVRREVRFALLFQFELADGLLTMSFNGFQGLTRATDPVHDFVLLLLRLS
jgi:hypothetical protein